MSTIIQIFKQACEQNLDLVGALLLLDLFTTIINIVYGTIQGSLEEGFDFKKFLFGFVKLFASQVLIFGFCFCLNAIGITLDQLEQRLNIKIFTDDAQTVIISLIDVIVVIVARLKDTCIDILEKVKKQRTLKYISYDDISVQACDKTEEGIG